MTTKRIIAALKTLRRCWHLVAQRYLCNAIVNKDVNRYAAVTSD